MAVEKRVAVHNCTIKEDCSIDIFLNCFLGMSSLMIYFIRRIYYIDSSNDWV